MFNAGETNNVIPDTCKIGGTIRTFDSETQASVVEGFKKVLEGLTTSTDVTYDLKYSKGYPPVINTERETDLILEATQEVDSVYELVELEASLSGEDFSYYQQRVPGAFFYTGTRNEHFKADFPHHHPKFDIDEKGLINAVRIFLLTTFKFMEGDYKNDLNA